MEYIRIHLIDLPPRIHGLTVYKFDDGDAFFTVFLNSRLSDEMIRAAYDHEIEHINAGDFDSMHPVDELEGIRHAV